MKVSVQLALHYLRDRYRPPVDFAWLLAPADMPRLSPAIITRLLDEHQAGTKRSASTPVLVPTSAIAAVTLSQFPWQLQGQGSCGWFESRARKNAARAE